MKVSFLLNYKYFRLQLTGRLFIAEINRIFYKFMGFAKLFEFSFSGLAIGFSKCIGDIGKVAIQRLD